MEVYMVIDDYTPDAGSSIYGVFTTEKAAQQYLDVGIKEDYGDDTARSESAEVRSITVQE